MFAAVLLEHTLAVVPLELRPAQIPAVAERGRPLLRRVRRLGEAEVVLAVVET